MGYEARGWNTLEEGLGVLSGLSLDLVADWFG